MTLSKKNIPLLVLNGIALFVYFFVFYHLNTKVSHEIMFSTPDSVSYLDVANWFSDGIDSKSISIRPILYPLVILFASKLGGVYGIWGLQLLFWIASINFIFLTVKKITGNLFVSYIAAAIIITNISLIIMTLHALTEVITIFLISSCIWILSSKINNIKEVSFIHTFLFFLVLLTIIKPVFYLPLLATVFIAIPCFYLKKYKRSPKSLLFLLLILAPVFIQLGIIKVKFNETKISLISSNTLKEYFIAQGIEKIESLKREQAIQKAYKLSTKEQKNYLYNNASVFYHLFTDNIKNNIRSRCNLLLFPARYANPKPNDFMIKYNKHAYNIHKLFLFFSSVLMIILLFKKEYSKFFFLGGIYLLGLYYILATGISFWQGDRLVLGALPLSACLYPIVVFEYYKIGLSLKRKKNLPSHN